MENSYDQLLGILSKMELSKGYSHQLIYLRELRVFFASLRCFLTVRRDLFPPMEEDLGGRAHSAFVIGVNISIISDSI